MRPDLEMTSVPHWALTPTRSDADLSGRAWTIMVLGPGGTDIARDWVAQIASAGGESAVRLHVVDPGQAIEALTGDVAAARVGWRLMMTGPADACLQLRGAAMSLGVADDEMTVASTDVDSRAVRCVHCGAVTRARVQLDEVLACGSCERKLLVYYHVSRRHGTYLGFMADAEAPAEASSRKATA
jgi:dimethylamine monooxygenase subunit C